ncbi:LysR family transcriptional regulator [Embleya sp. NBC_00896]|uniref:LysR family transcriptional regulator n=1 Tax=Embleya sp. NBC_00896 TaxID=2975961 RepID=UPI0038635D2A|nr:LysR family transcriptional regulator [Embleya sp. NBC_00896]
MELKRLNILRALDEHGTVAAAAQSLHLTPSAVSQQLAVLAREADAVLLEKNGRGVRLTAAAHVLLGHADAIATRLERARADLAAQRDGRIGRARVSSFPSGISGLVAPALARLKVTHPGWRFEVVQHETEEALPLLPARELDMALVMTHPDLPTPDHPRIELHPLLDEPFEIALPTDHPLAGRAEVDLAADLADADWIITAPGTACHGLLLTACHHAGFQPRLMHTSTDFGAQLALVAAGLGVTIIPRLAQPTLPAGVVLRPLTAPAPRRHLMAAVRRGHGPSPLLTALREVGAELAARKGPGS